MTPSQTATSAHVDARQEVENSSNGSTSIKCSGHVEQNRVGGLLLLAQLEHLRSQSSVNMLLALGAVLYFGIQVVCLVLNSFDKSCDMEDPMCDAATTEEVFHALEFWGTFGFNVVAVLALLYSPKRLDMLFWSPVLLKVIVCVNISSSFVTALLVTINGEKFEMPAHELEYANELTMALVDMIILVPLLRDLRQASGDLRELRPASAIGSVLTVSIAVCVAVVQLGLYNGLGWDGHTSRGEKVSHYCEFSFGIISSCITFWFTMDNKLMADAQIKSIMHTAILEPV